MRRYKKVGDEISTRCKDWTFIEQACWEKFYKIRDKGLQANGFFIKTITLLRNGGCVAIFQPIKT